MKKLLVAMLVALIILMGVAYATPPTGDFTVSGGVYGVDYTFADGVLTVKTGTLLSIYGDGGGTTTNSIVLDPGAGNETNIRISNVFIRTTGAYSPIDVKSGTANIFNVNFCDLTFAGSDNRAALHVPYGTTLVLDGYTTLTCVVENGMGAAIGGNGNSGDKAERNGTIVINCPVTATVNSTNYPGAAIGTGSSVSGGNQNNPGGTITINDGNVTASTKWDSAAIGGGYGCVGGNVIINGGNVKVTGGNMAYSIGAGRNSSSSSSAPMLNGGTLTINDGTVRLCSSANAAITVNGGELYDYDSDSVPEPSLGGLTVNGGKVNLYGVRMNSFTSSNKLIFRKGELNLNGLAAASMIIDLDPALGKQSIVKYNSNTYTYDDERRLQINTQKLNVTSSDASTHSHAACGDYAYYCTHTPAHTNVSFTALTDATQLNNGGNYYLTSDLTITRYITIDETVNLCLNGYRIDLSDYDNTIKIEGGTLNLCDCDGNGVVSESYSRARWAGPIQVSSNGTFNMYSGTVGHSSAYRGSGVYMSSTSAVFNMYGGTIANCMGPYSTRTDDVDSYGGAIYMTGCSTTSSGGATFRMYGGTIDFCAADIGGAIYAERDCTIVIENARIQDCRADAAGSAIYFYTHTSNGGTANFSIKNTTFYNCTGYDPKKAISTSDTPVLELKTDELKSAFKFTRLTIDNCTFTNCSGVPLDLDGIKAEIKNSTLSSNVSSQDSLAIDLYNSDVVVTDSRIVNNSADLEGDYSFMPPTIYASNSILKMDGCTISNNRTNHNASGIYVSVSSITLKDTDITGNRSVQTAYKPAGVYMTSNTSNRLYLEGKVHITGNINVGNNINNVYLAGNQLITLTDGTLDSGSSVGVTSAEKTASNIVPFLERSSGDVVQGDLAAFTSDEGYTKSLLSGKGVLGTPVTVTVVSNSGQGGTVSGGGTVNAGTSVTVKATPNEKYAFVSWTDADGDVVSTDAEYTFTAAADTTLTANFATIPMVTITVRSSDESLGEASVGTDGVKSITVRAGTEVTASAAKRNTDLVVFNGWYDSSDVLLSTSADYSFTAVQDMDLTAKFSLASNASVVRTHIVPEGAGTATGGGIFLLDSTVSFTATANEGYRFVNWTNVNGSEITASPSFRTSSGSKEIDLFANFRLLGPIYTITATPDNASHGTVSGAGEYEEGESVTVTATPKQGYRFLEWQENGATVEDTGASYTFTVESARTLTAVFGPQQYGTLTINKQMNGATLDADLCYVTLNGQPFTSGTFGYGDTISLTPVFPEDHFECHGFQQQGHEDGYGGSDTFTFTMPEEPNVVMNVYFFPRSFEINVTVEPAEAASATEIGGTGTGLYGADGQVTAYCYEGSGYVFYGWYDSTGTNLLSTNSSYDFVIDGKTDLIAKVVPSGEYVRIEAQPSDRDGATVSGSGAYQVGSTATLTVTTNSGYTFVGWEGNSHEEPFSTATSITVDVPDHNMYYTAIIAKDGETHTLNISAENGSVVNKNGVAYPATSEHESSKYVHLLPKPNDGYEFDHWEITEDRHSYNTDREDLALTMTHNWTVKAVFREVTYRLDYDVVNGGEGGSIAVSPNYASGAELDKGIEVTLTATPDTEYEVYEWVIFYGDESFEDATHITDKDTVTVTMTDDVRVTLEFRKPQQGGDEPAPTTAIIETRVEGDGSVTADTDPIEGNLYELPVGEEITLTATPGEGHVFLRWDVETPDASLTEEYSTATITLAPEKHTIAKAVFIPDDEETLFEFAISTRGNGEVESTHKPGRLPVGTEITLTAKPETDCTFEGWHVINMGNGSETVYTDETLTIKLTKDTEVLAEFSWAAGTTFNLSFYTYGEGYINTSHQAGAYAPGTEIELTAIPADGWRFSRWVIRARGGETREEISTTITLEADTEIHVEFLEGDAPSGGEDEELFFFDYFIGDGEGMVSANYAPEAMLPAGTEVTLTATPAEGYVFSVWTIDTPDSSSDPTEIFDAETTITIQENTYAFALFNQIGGGDEGGDEPELRIFEYHVNGNGSVESSHESGEYEVGTEIMLQAIPGEGATFIKWIIEFPDAGISEEITDAELPITLDENTVVIAEFSDDGGIGGEGSDTPVFEYSVSGNGSVESSHENGNYDFGTDIMLKAIPNEGATFIKWIVEYPDHDSTEVITDEELLLTLDENTFVTAEFSAGGGIGGDSDTRAFEYSRSGNGSVVSSHENGNYAVGTEITLQAFPDVGAVFARWLVEFPDAGVSTEYTEESITIVLTENTVVVAQFADDGVSGGVGGDGVAQLFLLTDGNGRIECEYESGEFVPLGTPIPVTAIADEGFVFSHWVMEQSDISGAVASSEQSIEIILTTQTTLTAYFVDASTGVPDCELALATEGSGTLTGTSAGVYPPDTAIMLTAVPEDMWRVCAWLVTDLDTGDSAILETNQTEFTFVLRQNVLITVVFEPGYVIEAKANDEALGTVTGSGVYYAGEEVTLTATPADEQSLFTGWYAVNADGTINLYSEESELVFSPTSDLTLVAWFTSAEVAQYVINTTAVPEVGGLVTGEGFYDEGATVTLTATANDGYTFIGWYENNTVITTEATLTFTAESNRNIEARFDAIEEPSSTVTLPTTSDGGTVSGAGEYEIGATVTVTATPEAGFIFNGWYVNGELVSTDPTYTFVVNGDVTLTPEFTDVRTKLLIITHPADAELFADETAVFSVTASGDGLTYQWQQSSRTLARTVNWINIDGATLPTYQVEATVERDGTQYRCIVTDQYGNTLTSDAATLTVLENPVLPPTGDGFNAALWLALLAVSTVGVILLRKRVRG